MISENQKTVGDYWSGRAKSTGNWSTNKLVVRDINRRVIGEPYSEVSRGALELGAGCWRGARSASACRSDAATAARRSL